ncbi:Os04g0447166, partial [Oryza sativa Japonica Group]
VRQHAGAATVAPGGVGIAPLDLLLGAAHVGRELPRGRQRRRVGRPRLVGALPEVLLVGGVRGQRVDDGHERRGLRQAGQRREEEAVRVGDEVRVLWVALGGHQAAHQRRAVRDVATERVLPEVERRVLRRAEPHQGGEQGGQVAGRREARPPRRAALVRVPALHGLGVPRLQLVVRLHGLVARVVGRHVRLAPPRDRRPEEQPVGGVRVVLDEQP